MRRISRSVSAACVRFRTRRRFLAIESAAGIKVPTNARLLRNLVLGANFIQSHILHFYLLAALEYITPPASAPWTPVWNIDLMRSSAMQQIATNFTTAVTMRREAHEMAAIFAGRMPGLSAIQAGGFTAKPTSSTISSFTGYLNKLLTFISNSYLPDVQVLSSAYPDYHQIGKGSGNFIAFGVFDQDDTSTPVRLLKRGVVYNSNPTAVLTLSTANITEMVTSSWYDNSTNNLNPAKGNTVTVHPATKPAAYSWLRTPRYSLKACDAGPLARMWINGDYRQGVSVMDRHMARVRETQKVADAMLTWLDQLTVGGPGHIAVTSPFSKSGQGLAYAVLGNHDYERHGSDKVEAELAYAQHGGTRWRMPARCYRFAFPEKDPLVTFLCLDSNLPGTKGSAWNFLSYTMSAQERAAQDAWLREQLAAERQTPFLVVAAHHPLYSNGGHGDNAILIRHWDSLLREYKVDLYLAGHDHDLQHLEFAGHPTSFVISGGGGAKLVEWSRPPGSRGPWGRQALGFTDLEVSAGELVVRHVGVQAETVYGFRRDRRGKVTIL